MLRESRCRCQIGSKYDHSGGVGTLALTHKESTLALRDNNRCTDVSSKMIMNDHARYMPAFGEGDHGLHFPSCICT